MTLPALRERASPNHDSRGEPPGPVHRIDTLVLHYTGMPSAAAALDRLCDPAARVSAPYLVEEDGTLWRLVAEDRRAWHAGVSAWEGEGEINARSLGIEIVNPGHEWGYRPFPEAQMRVVEELCRDLVARHAIPATRIVGHSDIAPERKADPGELFDWPRLARAGIGLWPEPAAPLPPATLGRPARRRDRAAPRRGPRRLRRLPPRSGAPPTRTLQRLPPDELAGPSGKFAPAVVARRRSRRGDCFATLAMTMSLSLRAKAPIRPDLIPL